MCYITKTKHCTSMQEDVVELIQKRWGKDAIGIVHEKAATPILPKGVDSPKELLGGWIPRGALTELLGSPTSGLTTIALHVLAAAQHEGDVALSMDLAGVFDADYAAQCGVRFDDLILIQPTFEVSQEMLFDAVATGIPGVVVFNTFPVLRPRARQQLVMTLNRLHGLLRRSHCALLVLCPHQQGSISSRADGRLEVVRTAWLFDGQDVTGYQSQVTILRHPVGTIGQRVQFYIPVDEEEGV